MKFFLFIYFFSTMLWAKNPIVYASLGDFVYNNLEKIMSLQYIPEYNQYKEELREYKKDVFKAKEYGFSVENKLVKYDKLVYLQTLRSLSKKSDFFLRDVQLQFKKSIATNNSKLFNQLINTGLIDIELYNDQIIAYYSTHIDEIDGSEVTILKKSNELKQEQYDLNDTKQKVLIPKIEKKIVVEEIKIPKLQTLND